MRTQGGGGQKTVKFCGGPLWMAPYDSSKAGVVISITIILQAKRARFTC